MLLHARAFGGKARGKYRISRKFLRRLAGRRRLPQDFLAALALDLFDRGYVLIDLETYFVVQEQRLFAHYRRVTAVALEAVSPSAPESATTSVARPAPSRRKRTKAGAATTPASATRTRTRGVAPSRE